MEADKPEPRGRACNCSDRDASLPGKPKAVSKPSLGEKALALIREKGVVRTKDLEAIGVPRQYPRLMCREGFLEQVSYGLYRISGRETD
jgi:hypothetical protein